MTIKTLTEAKNFLDSAPRSGSVIYDDKISRMRLLLNLLDNPQDSFQSVHVAGTSGKGSTVTIIATLLRAAGKTVGQTMSPHVQDVRERFTINGSWISDDELCEHINRIDPVLAAVAGGGFGPASFFEIVTAIAFLAFAKHRVDYAIVEVGLGGKRDATNVINRQDKLAIINQIGLDHVSILGHSVIEIAREKAGIIQSGTRVVALSQEPSVNQVFSEEAAQYNADLELFVPGKHVQHIHLALNGTVFNSKLKPWIWRELKLSLVGRHQAVNAGLALRAVQILVERDGFKLDETAARNALASLTIPGRFDIKHAGNKLVILDGAHNQQKLTALCDALKAVFPSQKLAFLVAFKSDKDLPAALKVLAPLASHVIATTFSNATQDSVPDCADPASIVGLIGSSATAMPDSGTALEHALSLSEEVLVVTGSFYLLGEVYNELNERGIS